jgi:hypothetical protein
MQNNFADHNDFDKYAREQVNGYMIMDGLTKENSLILICWKDLTKLNQESSSIILLC